MWLSLLLMFVITVVLSAIFGTLAKARFIGQLQDRHADLFAQLGSPGKWVVKSFSQGVAIQRLVFSNQPVLSEQTESARISLRRITVLVIVALLMNCVGVLAAL